MTESTTDWQAAIDDWTTWLRAAGRPQTTIRTRTYHLRRIAVTFADRSPWDVSTDDLIEWTGRQQWATETRRSYRSSMATFWRWALETGRAQRNPAALLPRVRPSQPRPRPTPDLVYSTAMLLAKPRVRLILRLAAEAGLRRSEIAHIHQRDLVEDLDGWSLTVHGKGDKERVVPLTPGLASELRAVDGWAFPGNDRGHLSPRYVGKLATRVLPDEWTLHSLRHRFATRAYAVDRDTFTVQALLGHASPATTRMYVRLPDGAKRRLVLAAAVA